jgi:hypothetical protein
MLQVPVWQVSLEPEQSFGVPPQTPAVHWSVSVHGLASLHVVPLALLTATHWPLAALQVPVWHASSRREQSVALPPHTPAVHWSCVVQRFPSSQFAPSRELTAMHWPVSALQVPVRHAVVRFEQSFAVPAHTPSVHWSDVVHGSPSSQVAPLVFGAPKHWPF